MVMEEKLMEEKLHMASLRRQLQAPHNTTTATTAGLLRSEKSWPATPRLHHHHHHGTRIGTHHVVHDVVPGEVGVTYLSFPGFY
jgi:hypothetical protein